MSKHKKIGLKEFKKKIQERMNNKNEKTIISSEPLDITTEENEKSNYGFSYPPTNYNVEKQGNENLKDVAFVTTERFELTNNMMQEDMNHACHLGEMSMINIEMLIRYLVDIGIINGSDYQTYIMNTKQ